MKKLLLAVTVLSFGALKAQQLPLYSQYYFNQMLLNPAKTGFGDNINANLVHRSQWKDIPGAPVTNALTIDGPVKGRNIGLGLTVFSDREDLLSKTGVYTSYSYNLKINEDSKVLFGAGLGFIDNRIDGSRIVGDINDPLLFGQSQRKASLDGAFGAMYVLKALEVGVAVPHIIGNKVVFGSDQLKSSSYRYEREYHASAKYSVDIMKDKGLSVDPLVVVRVLPNAPVQYDINAILNWKDIGWLGLSYRSDYAVGINARVKLYKSLSAGYAYDIITSPVKSFVGISHEIMLGYTFGSEKKEETGIPSEDIAALNAEAKAVDSLMNIIKKTTDIHTTEIKKLQDEMSKLKADTAKAKATEESMENLQGFMKLGSVKDFRDAVSLNQMPRGNYVVIGAFKEKANAEKSKQKYVDKGNNDTRIMVNGANGLYYVFINVSDIPERAVEVAEKARKEGAPDAWVLYLE